MTSNSGKTGPTVRYVAVGDSTGVGVGSQHNQGYAARVYKRIEQEHPGSQLVNLCVSGATSGDLIRTQLQRAIDAQPTLVTIGIGINDSKNGGTVEQFAKDYEEIISRLKKETGATIVVTNIPDISYAPAMPQFYKGEIGERIKQFNARIAEIAERYDVPLVDSYTPTRELIPKHPEFFSGDGFHPSDQGYEYWAKMMWPTIEDSIRGKG